MALSEAAGFVHHHIAVSTGITLHLVERSGAGTPVILLHGIWGTWESWLPVIDLPNDPFAGRPLWLLDLRGHGACGKPTTGYALKDYAADVTALVAARGAERVILCGHSLGALTSFAAARQMPKRVEALILEEPPLPMPTDVSSLDGFWAAFAEAVIGLLLLKHQPVDVIVRELMGRDPELTAAEAEDAAGSIANTADGVFTAIINGEFGTDGLTDGGPLDIPALIFQGALPDQRALSDDGLTLLRRQLPESRVVVLPETGHSVHQADPRGFSLAVQTFLQQGESN
jgi:pimeloyl-ACP methyl ester carboxylesterase